MTFFLESDKLRFMFMPTALSKAVERIAKRNAGKDWNLYAALLEHWQEIVGMEYANNTTPVKITFPHQPNEQRRINGLLCIRLPKGLAMEMSFKTDQIRQRINSYFGYDAIARIAFDPVFEKVRKPPSTPKPADPEALAKIQKVASGIESDAVREALESFGAAVLTRKATDAGAPR